ncbi:MULTISPECIES: hypothetical protein [Bacillaceae]|uniref:Uncharacterized protein n=2 Tax=Bacillus infantis TaxID=324767 RepID=U5LGX8_9BACI|nr:MULTISPECIES: hypothetical protein [Bacillus]OXT15321.1 hypothetical protein B9K06_21480 [Bacillus sp. OG2]AGX05926.1 hypothetical protein N288_20265 [Bacillus infantis NRRL B-14911]EAR64746.1 hypothetical protein B14911_24210 [Bacillus sp. NRRL B-14911]MCA1037692.1 hypothetical protein [Bacillus infantis]MCK6205201.1 hypothetical protein [Bacillus infantis]
MNSNQKVIIFTKNIGGAILAAGILTFLAGFFANGSSLLTPIGIGMVIGAVFIFLMGIFFKATEEMLEKTEGCRLTVQHKK